MLSLLPALLSSLDYLSYYGVDIPLQLGWLTLPTVGSTPSARNATYGDADAFFEGIVLKKGSSSIVIGVVKL